MKAIQAIDRLLETRHLFVSLEPGRMAAVCLGGRLGQGLTQVLASVDSPLTAQPDREALSALLQSAVSAVPRPARVRRLTVTLSDLLVRYLVLRRPDGLRSLAELHELAAQQLCERFELDAADWVFRVDAAFRGTHDTVCAMPGALLQNLRDAAADAGLRLRSVQPHLITELARHGRRNGWIATTERNGFAFAYLADQALRDIRVVRSSQPSRDLPIALRRESIARGLPEDASARVTGLPSSDRGTLPAAFSAVGAERWPSEGPLWSAQYRLALAPIWPRES